MNIIPRTNHIKSRSLYWNALKLPQLISGEYFSRRWCIENLQNPPPRALRLHPRCDAALLIPRQMTSSGVGSAEVRSKARIGDGLHSRCWAGKKRACALCSSLSTSLLRRLHGCSVCEHHLRQGRDNSRPSWGASCRLLSAAPERLTPARIASTVTAKCSFEQTRLSYCCTAWAAAGFFLLLFIKCTSLIWLPAAEKRRELIRHGSERIGAALPAVRLPRSLQR